jgi:tetratricopeptide (TPR) repeat protein
MVKLKSFGLALIPLLLISAIASALPVVSENSNSRSQEYAVLLVKAKILYEMLNRSLALNISTDLRNEIQSMLSVNISALTIDGLREWFINASRLLARVNEEVRVGGRAYAVGIVLERYLNGLRKALEERFRRLNISIPVNITKARDISELNKMLKNYEKVVEVLKVQRFANISITYALKNAVKGVDEAEEAYKHLAVAEGILDRVIEKFKKLNVSEDTLEALQIALGRVREVREVVVNATKIARNYAKNIEESLKSVIGNRTAEVLMEIEVLKQELLNLKDVVANVNLSQFIDDILSRVEVLRNRVLNASIEDIPRWLPDLGEIKSWVKIIISNVNRTATTFIPRWIPVKGIDKAFNDTLTRVEKLLNEVKQMLNKIKESKIVFCIAVYPPPPICKAIWEARIDIAEKTVAEAETSIAKAKELYTQGKKVEALLLLNRVYAELQIVKAWLEPLYNTIEKELRTETPPTTTPTTPQTTPPTQLAKLIVKEAMLRKERCIGVLCRYKLTLTIRNEGNTEITIYSVALEVVVGIQRAIGITLKPGEERTIIIELEIPTHISITLPTKATLVTSSGNISIEIKSS